MQNNIIKISRFSTDDGPGIRTTVFLKGCPLKCLWCHNPDTLSFEKEVGSYSPKCASCGTCAKVCQGGAIQVDGVFEPEKCVRCYDCIEACPAGARELYGEEWESRALAD